MARFRLEDVHCEGLGRGGGLGGPDGPVRHRPPGQHRPRGQPHPDGDARPQTGGVQEGGLGDGRSGRRQAAAAGLRYHHLQVRNRNWGKNSSTKEVIEYTTCKVFFSIASDCPFFHLLSKVNINSRKEPPDFNVFLQGRAPQHPPPHRGRGP